MTHGNKPPKGNYKVGYGRPPLHAQFRKGQSGNPSGRPRAARGAQVEKLILEEAYRKVTVKEGDNVVTIPAIQAIVRGQVVRAAKGNGPSQRAFLSTVQGIEQRRDAEEAARASRETNAPEMSELDRARRIAFALEKAARSNEAKQPAARDEEDNRDKEEPDKS